MNVRLGPLILVAVALLGCREKPPAPPPTPAPGAEIALFRIGLSEADVERALPAVPNYRKPDGAGFALARTGAARSGWEATPWKTEADRPVSMRFAFEAQRLVQAELIYRAPDAAARGALYDRLLAGVAGAYARSTNRVLGGGGRAAWLHAPDHMLLVHESRPDPRAVSVRLTRPVFE